MGVGILVRKGQVNGRFLLVAHVFAWSGRRGAAGVRWGIKHTIELAVGTADSSR